MDKVKTGASDNSADDEVAPDSPATKNPARKTEVRFSEVEAELQSTISKVNQTLTTFSDDVEKIRQSLKKSHDEQILSKDTVLEDLVTFQDALAGMTREMEDLECRAQQWISDIKGDIRSREPRFVKNELFTHANTSHASIASIKQKKQNANIMSAEIRAQLTFVDKVNELEVRQNKLGQEQRTLALQKKLAEQEAIAIECKKIETDGNSFSVDNDIQPSGGPLPVTPASIERRKQNATTMSAEIRTQLAFDDEVNELEERQKKLGQEQRTLALRMKLANQKTIARECEKIEKGTSDIRRHGDLENVGETWDDLLTREKKEKYYEELQKFLDKEEEKIAPPIEDVFAWTRYCRVSEVKVVIVGQDPCPTPNCATGLCFSVKKTTKKIPPSLDNIFKELTSDVPGFKHPGHGDLTKWAKQGVLLLNAVLTYRRRKTKNFHMGKGWELFTNAVVQYICECNTGVVFMLWGRYAQQMSAVIDEARHRVLRSSHPSPLSAYRGFFGCRHFSMANEWLQSQDITEIDWCAL